MSASLPQDLSARLRKIRLLAMDVDGVLTDGQILLSPNGDELKAFHSRDGIGLSCLHRAGLASAFITARGSPAVSRRAEELGVSDVVLSSRNKREALAELCRKRGLKLEEVAFMGDDLQDLGALLTAGVSLSVRGCPEEIRERVHYVTDRPGGEGAVREAVELILKAQARWESIVQSYLP